jgi:hypothetical protein
MRRVYVWQLAKALIAFESAECDCRDACQRGLRDAPLPSDRIKDWVAAMLAICERHCEAVELSTARARIDNAGLSLGLDCGITFDQLRMDIKVLRDAIETDLFDRRFVFVPKAKAPIHDKFPLAWGEIWEQFP